MQYGSRAAEQPSRPATSTPSRINQALNAVATPPARSSAAGRDAGPGLRAAQHLHARSSSPAALNFLEPRASRSGNTTERVASLAFTGKLGDYGIKSPWPRKAWASRSAPNIAASTSTSIADFLSPTACERQRRAPPAGQRRLRRLRTVRRSPRPADQRHAVRQGHRRWSWATASRTTPRSATPTPTRWPATGTSSTACASAPATTAPSARRTSSNCSRRRTSCSTARRTPAPASTAGNPLVATCATIFHLTTAQVLAHREEPGQPVQRPDRRQPEPEARKSATPTPPASSGSRASCRA